MKVLFVRPNKDSFSFKPIGLSLLSAIAKEEGWQVRLFDTTAIDFGFVDNIRSGESAQIFKPVDFSAYGLEKKKTDLASSFTQVFEEFNPDCIAFSVLSDEFMIAAEISALAKKFSRHTPVIWGGKYPTLNPEKVLQRFNADFVCISEGLDAFREFLKALADKGDPRRIPNIWAKKGMEIIENDIRPIKRNLDDLPYVDWEIFDKKQFYKPFDGKVYVGGDHMLNWGCPYHCTYCINDFYHKIYDNKYLMRRYSVARIIRELKYLKEKYRLEFIKFHDEDFLMRPLDNLRELSRAYKAEVDIPFVIETNPKSVTEEKVKLLKEMHCVSASVAIETGNPGLRKDLLGRVDSEEDVIRAFSLLRDAGIRTVSFNMFGIPFETRRTYEETIGINRKAQVQYPSSGFFYPFEGTRLREVSIGKGFFNPKEQELEVYRRDRPALRFDNLSDDELIQMRNVFILYVKLPEDFWPYIKRSEIQDEAGIELRRILLDIYHKTVWANGGWYNDDGRKDSYLKGLAGVLQDRADC